MLLPVTSCCPVQASPDIDRYVEALVEARKHKGLTEEQARNSLGDPNAFGVMMVQTGDMDGMVSGAAHTTAATIRPALMVGDLSLKSVSLSPFPVSSSIRYCDMQQSEQLSWLSLLIPERGRQRGAGCALRLLHVPRLCTVSHV